MPTECVLQAHRMCASGPPVRVWDALVQGALKTGLGHYLMDFNGAHDL
jgi:hypothetical protein